jgi:tetratricopeptide (TPR) repeat protein
MYKPLKTSSPCSKITLLILLNLLPIVTFANEDQWKSLNEQTFTLYQQGRYSEAAKVAEKALTVAEKTFDSEHPDVAQSPNNLAKCCREMGKKDEAEKLEARANKIRSKR